MRMEDMPKYTEPDWDAILSSVEWTEFDYLSRKFRVGQYTLDGKKFTSVELFLSQGAPTSDGWVGYRWCQQNGKDNDWPTQDVISRFVKQSPSPIDRIEEKASVEEVLKPQEKKGRIIRPRVN